MTSLQQSALETSSRLERKTKNTYSLNIITMQLLIVDNHVNLKIIKYYTVLFSSKKYAEKAARSQHCLL